MRLSPKSILLVAFLGCSNTRAEPLDDCKKVMESRLFKSYRNLQTKDKELDLKLFEFKEEGKKFDHTIKKNEEDLNKKIRYELSIQKEKSLKAERAQIELAQRRKDQEFELRNKVLAEAAEDYHFDTDEARERFRFRSQVKDAFDRNIFQKAYVETFEAYEGHPKSKILSSADLEKYLRGDSDAKQRHLVDFEVLEDIADNVIDRMNRKIHMDKSYPIEEKEHWNWLLEHRYKEIQDGIISYMLEKDPRYDPFNLYKSYKKTFTRNNPFRKKQQWLVLPKLKKAPQTTVLFLKDPEGAIAKHQFNYSIATGEIIGVIQNGVVPSQARRLIEEHLSSSNFYTFNNWFSKRASKRKRPSLEKLASKLKTIEGLDDRGLEYALHEAEMKVRANLQKDIVVKDIISVFKAQLEVLEKMMELKDVPGGTRNLLQKKHDEIAVLLEKTDEPFGGVLKKITQASNHLKQKKESIKKVKSYNNFLSPEGDLEGLRAALNRVASSKENTRWSNTSSYLHGYYSRALSPEQIEIFTRGYLEMVTNAQKHESYLWTPRKDDVWSAVKDFAEKLQEHPVIYDAERIERIKKLLMLLPMKKDEYSRGAIAAIKKLKVSTDTLSSLEEELEFHHQAFYSSLGMPKAPSYKSLLGRKASKK